MWHILLTHTPLLYLTQSFWRDEAFYVLASERSLGFIVAKLGFELFATGSTADYLRQQSLEVRTVLKLTEGRPNVADVIKNREVVLVINTPSGRRSHSDIDLWGRETSGASRGDAASAVASGNAGRESILG